MVAVATVVQYKNHWTFVRISISILNLIAILCRAPRITQKWQQVSILYMTCIKYDWTLFYRLVCFDDLMNVRHGCNITYALLQGCKVKITLREVFLFTVDTTFLVHRLSDIH